MYTPPPKLFDEWLSETKKIQEAFFIHHYGPQLEAFEAMTTRERVAYIKEQHLSLVDELQEAMGEISWKPWATEKFLHREAFIGEMIDLLHFAGNMLAAVMCTDEELNKGYIEKMRRNVLRQLNGYTGTDKCIFCKRAFDDIDAHAVNGEKGGRFRTDNGVSCISCARERGYLQ